MSLVGNLEDLSLGDILQIISLSQKSGVLVLQSDQGAGRIVFHQGMVRAACIKGWPDDLRSILVGGGFIDPAGFDAVAAHGGDRSASVEERLAEESGLGRERIDALLREAVEAAILEMFVWLRGDFSFDVRTERHPEDPQLWLPNGLNAQYLAMEGMRLRDERAREGDAVPLEADLDFSGEVTAPASGLVELDLEAVVSEAKDPVDDAEPRAADVLVATVLDREETDARAVSGENGSAGRGMRDRATGSARSTAVVLIDPDVSVLEWVKLAIRDDYARVHVFQQVEQGLARIRQYLVRGERPVVLISPEAEVDPLSGIHGLADFVKRLKGQAPGLRIFGLREDADPVPVAPAGLDAVLVRPARRVLRLETERGAGEAARGLSSALQSALADDEPTESAAEPVPAPRTEPSLKALEAVTARLSKVSTRGAILPLVLEFASELFSRVAIWLVRDAEIVAIAGRGIPALEGEQAAATRVRAVPTEGEGWVADALARGRAVQGPPVAAADRALLAHLGLSEPAQAFIGPIESGGVVIALLYGDCAALPAAFPDTTGLEVVLHHAGLALDRAVLERALSQDA